MERVLKDLKPEKVFYFFEEISRIPRGSGNEQAISDYLVRFANERGLEVKRDAALNVVIDKPATPGYEDRPKLMLQGHMDMVCVKDPGVVHDFEKDPISLVIDGEFLRADGTSLGADDGNAVSLCLALLDDDEIKHPAFQAVFTTAEEIGCLGAKAIDISMMDGDYLIGLDYSQDSNILVSCSGSSTEFYRVREKKQLVVCPDEKIALRICLSSLTSGHSGNEIIKGRANAIRVMGEILTGIAKGEKKELTKIQGGAKKNVIPAEAEATVLVSKSLGDQVQKEFAAIAAELQKEYRLTDPDMCITCEEVPVPETCYSYETTEKLLALIGLMPNGLQNYLNEERTLTKCSNNMGVIREKEYGIEIETMVRSNSGYEHKQIVNRMEQLAKHLGVELETLNWTGAWEYIPNSAFASKVQDIWEKTRGTRPPFNIIHAEVETGLFIEKMAAKGKHIEAVNLGIRNYDVHTPRERVEIASLGRTYELLVQILENIDARNS